ncbi:fimbrillin family protein [Bacteroides sp. OttesenSCG-928-D19]|nr:fimbrillin family protein [Bacteroides sp. OttesenSCG-928-D19]
MNLRLPILLTLTSLIVASCAGESHTERDTIAPISLTAQVITRGSTTTTPAEVATRGGFNIWAYAHDAQWTFEPEVIPEKEDPPLMNGRIATSKTNGITWGYGTPVDWPQDKFVSFFAAAPAAAFTLNSGRTETDGKPVIDYTVPATAANHTDLLIASPVYNQHEDMYNTNNNAVPIHFNHALSRIIFSGVVLNDNNNRVVKVKSITIGGVYNTGTTPMINPPVWEPNTNTTAAYTLSGATLTTEALSTTPKDICTATGNLFLLPQSLARTVGNDITMEVILDIDGGELKHTTPIFSPTAWEPGKTYNYQIVVDGNDLQVILIDTDLELESWKSLIMVQPISLGSGQITDQNRIHSALNAFVLLNKERLADKVANEVKYYAIYLKNDVKHDIVIDMTNYNDADDFTAEEQIIFDAEKLITGWGNDGTRYYNFSIINYEEAWELVDARQPLGNLITYNPEVDGVSSATTRNDGKNGKPANSAFPSNTINYKGSIILERK